MNSIKPIHSAISSRYTCSGENPKMVSISNVITTSVSFYNKLSSGSVKITKTTNTGQNLGGWKIGLYTDSACTNPISGSPFTTGSGGTVTVSGLQPGTLYAKELVSGDSYWVCDTSVKTITVVAGQTASVSFANTQYGALEIRKSTNTGKSTLLNILAGDDTPDYGSIIYKNDVSIGYLPQLPHFDAELSVMPT